MQDPLTKLMSTISIDENGCWNWTGSKYWDGYGIMRFEKKAWRTHRVSYRLHRGEIPDGLHVCHRCDNRACCNPDHLFLGTNAENTADKMAKGRYGTGQGAPPGERHGRSKLREADVLAIRSSTEKLRVLAERYGVSQSHIWKLRKGELWSHLSQQETHK